MTVTELIDKLVILEISYGDLPVMAWDDGELRDVDLVEHHQVKNSFAPIQDKDRSVIAL
jgi:hypothetical protein